jgi:hypothetical protein
LALGDLSVKNAKLAAKGPLIDLTICTYACQLAQGQGYVPVLQCQGADIMNAYQFQE